jgi:hypothetical protein|nr:MAG TPA: hypothetical protein [Caudoviricetes sp.]
METSNNHSELSADLLYRIGAWDYNRHPEESLTQELFNEYFGRVMGTHYYSKWEGYYKYNIIAMVGYLHSDRKEAQLFCDMIMQKVTQYEQRKNQKR